MSVQTIPCREKAIHVGGRTLIMGVLNVTPDSFSDGGLFTSVDAALRQARRMAGEGADLIDIGGESTRPGSVPVSAAEELERVIPVIRALKAEIDLPLSIDTYKAEVARQALLEGVHIVNDVWGLKADADMAGVIASFDCPVVIMHNRKVIDYADLMPDLIGDLRESLRLAMEAGIAEDKIMLDPGIGFGKRFEHNLEVMDQLDRICGMGYPVVLGTSRKSFIRKVLGLPSDQVVEGTIASVVMGIVRGCQIVRVHDVKEVRRAVMMTDAMLGRAWEGGESPWIG